MATLEEMEGLLTEFMSWQGERRVAGTDLSPEAFLIDRAKEQSLQQLIRVEELVMKHNDYKISDEEFMAQVYKELGYDFR